MLNVYYSIPFTAIHSRYGYTTTYTFLYLKYFHLFIFFTRALVFVVNMCINGISIQ